MKMERVLSRWMAWLLILFVLTPPGTFAQTAGGQPLKQEELDALLAPIALYPDDLVAQILMASTYPLEVVMADRWVKANKNLKGDPLTEALEKQDWDPSVKSLANFPQVLEMMSEKLDWTEKLGDAFLASQKDVMDTVQKLRFKAQEAGNLKTTEQQKVIVQEKVIVIEPARPQVIYVPTYNPTVVYGPWPYPAYPPYYYYPPGYVAGAALFSFGVGVAVGAAWGYAWGGCNWRGGDVYINNSRNVNINNKIDRGRYANQLPSGGQGRWQHDANHRRGAAYRDQATAERFNRGSSNEAVRSREAFRGRAEQSRQNLSQGGGRGPSERGARASTQPSASQRGATASQRGGRESAFGGRQQGSQVRQQSDRGQASRASMSSRGGGGLGGGGMATGGGAGRGGGGRVGGGRR